MIQASRQPLRLTGGSNPAFVTAGDPSSPAVLLVHGFPGSADYFRDVVPELSKIAHVIAPDLPGYGESDVLPAPSFTAFGEAIVELLDHLSIGPRYIYLHDFGAPPAFHVAMHASEKVLGLIVQNANAHQTGLGPQWDPVRDYWAHPNPDNEAAATAHLTFEGLRNGYLGGMPPEVAARVSPATWEEDPAGDACRGGGTADARVHPQFAKQAFPSGHRPRFWHPSQPPKDGSPAPSTGDL